MEKRHNIAMINREKGNSTFAHADQIRPQSEYEEQSVEKKTLLFLPLMIYWNNFGQVVKSEF